MAGQTSAECSVISLKRKTRISFGFFACKHQHAEAREPFMWRDLFNILRELWEATKSDGGSYRPDLHYMRGPGPKWHAKHAVAFATIPAKPSRSVPRHNYEHRV